MLGFEASKGVENLVTRVLAVVPGELVAVMHVGGGGVVDAIVTAVERLGGRTRRTDLGAFCARTDPESFASTAPELDRALTGAAVSMMLVEGAFPAARSIPILDAAKRHGTRHLHFLAVDSRVLAQSARAEPALLEQLNERVRQVFAASQALTVASPGGTDLRVRLSSQFAIATGHGQPKAGSSEGVPSGYVYTHPADVRGVVVVDRGVVGAPIQPSELRRTPLRVRIESARVVEVECADASIRERIDTYLASHANAGRVGLVLFPTNYLVRSEIGHRGQDALIPGLNVYLGFTESTVTRAPFDATVQLQLFARRETVRSGARVLVEQGRHAADLVEGIDPLR